MQQTIENKNNHSIETVSLEFSENYKQIFSAIINAQFKIPTINKSGLNTFFKTPANPNGSPYPTLDDIIDGTKEVLHSNGLGVIQGHNVKGNDFFMETYLIHTSGEWVKALSKMILSKNDMQGLGSTITYARRYAVSSLLKIVSEYDSDGNMPGTQPKSEPQPNKNHNQNQQKPKPNQAPTQNNNVNKPVENKEFILPGNFGIFAGKKLSQLSELNLNELLAFSEVELQNPKISPQNKNFYTALISNTKATLKKMNP